MAAGFRPLGLVDVAYQVDNGRRYLKFECPDHLIQYNYYFYIPLLHVVVLVLRKGAFCTLMSERRYK